MPESWQALLPFKGNDQAKTRLALPEAGRLAREWLETAVSACRACPAIEHTWVVGLKPPPALPQGVNWLKQCGLGLNEAIAEWLELRRPRLWLVILPDLPALSAGDVQHLLDACPRPGLALAPDRHGRGCNGLAAFELRPPLGFGEGSFQHYCSLALPTAVVRTRGLSHDVDTLSDWESLAWHQV